MRISSCISLAMVCVLSSCGDSDSTAPELAARSVPTHGKTPGGVEYDLVEDTGGNHALGIKRSVTVRLTRKICEADLVLTARQIRALDPLQYERTFILYYLPGMLEGSGAWATTHFKPNLEVSILGTSIEDEQRLAEESKKPAGSTIGAWNWEQVGARITIYREGDSTWLEDRFNDGSSGRTEVKEKSTAAGHRFDAVEPDEDGAYWLIRADGNLEIRDGEGLISRLPRAKER